ncbi:type I methionyl aminopeptidase [Ideonella sp. DXS29W]|uniref:Methionine aminopeptidase n=1 Tax=Ideonella lacteola TaxID=2984193 RepID=A0ABU9BSX2_9BURK
MRGPITLRTPSEIASLRESGRRAAQVLQMIAPYVQPGVSTHELDERCHDFIVNELRSVPANVGYRGYEETLCTSVNEVVCHGVPSPKVVLKAGDIVNIDVAVIHEGWYGDTSRMFAVGQVSAPARRLVEAAYLAMRAGIRQVRPGATIGDVGAAIERAARQAKYEVVREYGGHGIGTIYHDVPDVLNFGRPGQGVQLEPGMVFTVEPMLNAGGRRVRELDDGWTVVTVDGSLSAQWEHMVVVTGRGFEVLTPWPDGLGGYPAIG